MPKYIDADALMKRWSGEHGGAYFLPSEIVSSIEEQPTADVVERKKGKWVHDDSKWANRFICSECGYKLFDEPTNFCPNCGADMREETENAEVHNC